MKNDLQLKELLKRYEEGTATDAERKVLENWYNVQSSMLGEEVDMEEMDSAKANIWMGISRDTEPVVIRTSFRLWKPIAAAVLVIAFGAGLFYFNRTEKPDAAIFGNNDIAPGKNGATLTLANGQKILINDALAGNIATETGVKIIKTATGELRYEITGGNSGQIAFNTLSTTRGEQTQVRLPDGTLVFLNAESSLKYPTSFTGSDKRQVSLTGEGYFEVAKDKKHPFVVNAAKQSVEVLGTHFNINGYGDEPVTKTTLLEGSVRISPMSGKSAVLKPNQQSVLTQTTLKITEVDPENAVAWKNGLFVFDDEPLQNIMRRVSRWYNVEVIYQEGVDKNTLYWGSVSRYDKLSKVLEGLELTKGIHFKVEEGRITVMK